MNSFESDRQRKAAFANMNNGRKNRLINDISPQNPTKNSTRDLPQNLTKNSPQDFKIKDVITCQNLVRIASHTNPDAYLVIKGVDAAYKIYKEKPLNKNYENEIETIVKDAKTNIASILTDYQINYFSKKVIEQADDSGLIANISKETKIDGNIIKDIMEGTTSNLIEKGTELIINNVM